MPIIFTTHYNVNLQCVSVGNLNIWQPLIKLKKKALYDPSQLVTHHFWTFSGLIEACRKSNTPHSICSIIYLDRRTHVLHFSMFHCWGFFPGSCRCLSRCCRICVECQVFWCSTNKKRLTAAAVREAPPLCDITHAVKSAKTIPWNFVLRLSGRSFKTHSHSNMRNHDVGLCLHADLLTAPSPAHSHRLLLATAMCSRWPSGRRFDIIGLKWRRLKLAR